jgi:hypothetical protein
MNVRELRELSGEGVYTCKEALRRNALRQLISSAQTVEHLKEALLAEFQEHELIKRFMPEMEVRPMGANTASMRVPPDGLVPIKLID